MSIKFGIEPRVSYLSEILRELKEGIIQIPMFQRDIVWEWPQQRDLLCSIYEGLPIGAILIWNTRNTNIKARDYIGPFSMVKNNSNISGTYLMDGLQRLSTLYGMTFYSENIQEACGQGPYESYQAYCDLEVDEGDIEDLFLLKREIPPKELSEYPYKFMPLNLIFNTRELLRFQRSIPSHKEALIDRIESVVSAFKNYKIPVIPLDTEDQELVTKSFERINSRGTIMSEAHMLNALTYSEEFDLLSRIESERERYLSGLPNWNELDDKFILFLIKVNLGFDPYSKDMDSLATALSKNSESFNSVFSAIEKLAKFSEEYLDIDHPNDFPYRLQMLGIASEFLASGTEKNLEKLKSWFWISTYTNSFGTTARNSQNALKNLVVLMKEGRLPWTLTVDPVCRPLKNGVDVNYKSARGKAWSSALAGRLDSNSGLKENRAILRKFKGASLVRPLSFPINGRRRPGGCFLVEPKNFKTFNILEMDRDTQLKHFVSDVAYKLLEAENYDAFMDLREREIFEWELDTIIKPAAENAGFSDLLSYVARE